jgi:hypothetical protein
MRHKGLWFRNRANRGAASLVFIVGPLPLQYLATGIHCSVETPMMTVTLESGHRSLQSTCLKGTKPRHDNGP